MEWRFAWREIRNNRRFSAFFIFNLVLGLFGFLSLGIFKASIQQSLLDRSKLILTADLAIESRRPLTLAEERVIQDVLGRSVEQTRLWLLYSMVSTAHASRLAHVAAIEDAYPFYGQIELNPAGNMTHARKKDVVQTRAAWVSADMALGMRLKPGDPLTIGRATFQVSNTVTADAGNGWRAFDLAPRVYIGMNQLAATQLLQRGSVITYHRLFRLGTGQDAERLARTLNHRLSDPGIEVQTARDASESVGRLQGFLNDYLGLAALVSLFLSGLGAAFLFHSFLSQRLKDIAILMSVGMRPAAARRIYLWQLAFLGAIAACLSAGLAIALLPVTIKTLSWFIAYPVHAVFDAPIFSVALWVGVVGSILICLPFITNLRGLKVQTLFQETAASAASMSGRAACISALPAGLFYWGLAVWQAHSWRVGSLFIGIFIASGIILAAGGWLSLRILERRTSRLSLIPRLAVRNLARARFGSLAVFMAMGLGTLLLNLIPQVEKSLSTEIAQPKVSQVPSLFLFDIQPEQADALSRYMTAQGMALERLTPLIRARLTRVNDRPFEKMESPGRTREPERNARFRNRGFNLTYRAGLTEAESIVRGRPFQAQTQDPAEISVEVEFAKRLGLKLGDVMEFDIEGMPVRGQIVSLRKVQWASFQPNFFVQFQPGVLEDAPKTFLASIRRLDPTEKARLENGIARHFPNVSMIDVSELVGKILALFTQMSWALRAMALLALSAGFIVLFSIANHQAGQRRRETQLLKVLGASFSQIQYMLDWEFGGVAIIAALGGTAVSFIVSYALSVALFERVWVFSWQTPLIVIVTVPCIAIATIHLATTRVLKTKPLALLQSE